MKSISRVSGCNNLEALALAEETDTRELMRRAANMRDAGFDTKITYSRKVFIPLTQLCRDSCHYCMFAQLPRSNEQIYMSPNDVLSVVRQGEAAGCTEALFTLGDKPELRYRPARRNRTAVDAELRIIPFHTSSCAGL